MTLPLQPTATAVWLDASSPAATDTYDASDLGAVHLPMQIVTKGWLLRDDASGVTLASEWTGANSFRGLTCIPRAMIVSVTVDRTARKARVRVSGI